MIQINAIGVPPHQAARLARERILMESPLALAGIVAAFVIFGIVLAYVDRIAARRPDPGKMPAE